MSAAGVRPPEAAASGGGHSATTGGHPVLRSLERVADRLASWTGLGVMVLVAAFTLLVSLSVVLRYGFGRGLDWSEELGRYLMIWMGFLGASLALRNGAHVGVEMVREALPRPLRRIVILAGSLITFSFFVMVAYQGIRLIGMVWPQESLVLPISMFWPYLAIPIGMLLMIVQLVPMVVREWRSGAPVHPGATEERLT